MGLGVFGLGLRGAPEVLSRRSLGLASFPPTCLAEGRRGVPLGEHPVQPAAARHSLWRV
jgi:hypothetical protein